MAIKYQILPLDGLQFVIVVNLSLDPRNQMIYLHKNFATLIAKRSSSVVIERGWRLQSHN